MTPKLTERFALVICSHHNKAFRHLSTHSTQQDILDNVNSHSNRSNQQVQQCYPNSATYWAACSFKVRYLHRLLQCNDCTYSRPWPVTAANVMPFLSFHLPAILRLAYYDGPCIQ